jgi:hypothetical protein
MGGSSKGREAQIGPWPQGVNNVAKEHQLPVDETTGAQESLRAAVNVALDEKGNPSRREGYENVVTAGRAHSLFPTDQRLLAVVDGQLMSYDRDLRSLGVLRANVGDVYATCAKAVDDHYWSNGVEIRRFDAEFNDNPGWVPTPHTPTVAPRSSGGMDAGDYEIALTWKDEFGRESAPSPSVVVTVPDGGGVTLSNLPAAGEGVVSTCVYCSGANGQVLYYATELSPSQPTLYLGKFKAGEPLETQWCLPMPPSHILRFWNGRLWGASRNMLGWSLPLRYGLMHQDNTLRFGDNITMIEAVGEGEGGGLFVADHLRTYFLSGPIDNLQRVIRYSAAAVPGTSTVVPGTAVGLPSSELVAFWMARNGNLVIGMPDGKVLPFTENKLALPVDAERGAVMQGVFSNMRQIITTILSSGDNAMAASDAASATVRRHGVTVD